MNYAQDKVKPYSQDGSKTEQVETMFNHIAHAYDRLNHCLSWGIDRRWRRKALRTLLPHRPQAMLDVATGTGDFALLACRMLQPKELIATDISEEMMRIGSEKAAKAGLADRLTFSREDCTRLSFPDNRFDAITVAFGIRNFEDLDRGLQEMHRVLKPGGRLVILELTTPEHFPMKQLYRLYSRIVIPAVGRLLSHDRCAYVYLPSSIRAFPQGEIMRGVLQKNGFTHAAFQRLTCGICTLYTAEK